MESFQKLIYDVGELIGLPLQLDQNQACHLCLDNLNVQLEVSPESHCPLAVTYIASLPPGRFRADVLRAALNVNSQPQPTGILSYFPRNNHLALHLFFPFDPLTADLFLERFRPFLAEANAWREALEAQRTCPDHHLALTQLRP